MKSIGRQLLLPRFLYPNSLSALLLFLLLSVFFQAPYLLAQQVSKEEVLAKYEETLKLAEELNVYQQESLDKVPDAQEIEFEGNLMRAVHIEDWNVGKILSGDLLQAVKESDDLMLVDLVIDEEIIQMSHLLYPSDGFNPLLLSLLKTLAAQNKERLEKFYAAAAKRKAMNALAQVAKKRGFRVELRQNGVILEGILMIPPIFVGFEGKYELLLAKPEVAEPEPEEVRVYPLGVLPITLKIRIADQALLRDDFNQADRVLTEALSDLTSIKLERGTQLQRALRLEWLEIHREIIQKYAVLIILAYLFVSIPYFWKMFEVGHLTVMGKIFLTILIPASAILLSFFDLASYGETAWAFLDIQVVLLAIGGLLGGFWPGLFSGVIVGVFRWILRPNLVFFAIAVGAGIIGGLMSRRIKTYHAMGRVSFVTGAIVGMLHGMAVFSPMFFLLSWVYVLISVGFLCLTEATAVFIFMVVVSGILRKKRLDKTEKELSIKQT